MTLLNKSNPIKLFEICGDADNKIRGHQFLPRVFLNGQGQVSRYQTSGRDLAGTKELNSKRTDLSDRLEDRMSALGRVSAGIIHEIRNPISAIAIYLSILKNDYADEEQIVELVNLITNMLDRIERTVTQVRDFCKLQAPNWELAEINDCIRDAITLTSATLQQEKITLKAELDDHIPVTLLEIQSVSQVLLNLIINAADAVKNMKENKIIKISSSYENDFIFIRVSDSGHGIRPEDRDKLFDPFFTTKRNGLGIGLTLSYKIIREHGGLIHIADSELGGAEFEIVLPVQRSLSVTAES